MLCWTFKGYDIPWFQFLWIQVGLYTALKDTDWWVNSVDPDQTVQISRLIWIYKGQMILILCKAFLFYHFQFLISLFNLLHEYWCKSTIRRKSVSNKQLTYVYNNSLVNPFLQRYTFIARANSLDLRSVHICAVWSGSKLFAFWFISLFLTKMQPVQIQIRWHKYAGSTLVAHA
jgi:hypothetical protein